MGDSMKTAQPTVLRRIAGGALWTVALLGLIAFADRAIIPKQKQLGWNQAENFSEIPREAGLFSPPLYLPNTLAWPPAKILYKTKPEIGVWLGIADSATGEIQLWLGHSTGDLPVEMTAVAPCMDRAPGSEHRCPKGWDVLSSQQRNQETGLARGEPILLVTKLDPLQAARIREGLEVQSQR